MTARLIAFVSSASPLAENKLADGAAGFGLGMSCPEIFRVDRRQRFGEGRAELSSFDQGGDFVEDLPLDGYVRRLIHRAREHELPYESGALVLEQIQIERLGAFHDGDDASLRADDFGHHVPVCVGVAKVCDEAHFPAPQRKQLRGNRLTVVDYLSAPRSSTHLTVSGREAVAITANPASLAS